MDLPPSGGLLLVDKPAGPTSHDVVAAARRALGTRRVGHTGTLDPFATGLLVLCVGRATRLVEFVTGLPKRYLATVRLGERTTTDDLDGEVEAASDAWRALGRAGVESALASFRGPMRQVPPRYSAKKVAGEAAHYRARRGENVALAPVAVEVLSLELVRWEPPEIDLDVRCSAGTYVRALARDLGETLGTGAHLVALRRTEVGSLRAEAALDPERLGEPDVVRDAWIAPLAALVHLPRIQVGPEDASRLALGQSVLLPSEAPVPVPALGTPLAVAWGEELVAVAERAGDQLQPRKVFTERGPTE